MFVRKLFGLRNHLFSIKGKKPNTSAIHTRHTAQLPLGHRPLHLEPLEDRRMLSVTLHVDDDSAAPTPNGLAWETAYADFQSALDRAAELNTDQITDNDVTQIWIAEGTYCPTVELEPGDARSASFSLVDGVSLYGGFAGNETALEERDLLAHTTTLSGDRGVLDDDSDNAYTVVYCGEGIEAAINGVHITGGNADRSYDSDHPERNAGGGIYNVGTLTVASSTLMGNAANNGGGIYSEDATLTLTDSTISGNTAETNGGGIYNNQYFAPSFMTVTNSTISDNSAGFNGGGIYNRGDLTISNASVAGNSAGTSGSGGGFYNDTGHLTIINSAVTDNAASSGGGIINRGYDSSVTLENATVAGNFAHVGGGIYAPSDDHALVGITLNNSIVANNTVTHSGPDLYHIGGTLSGAYNLIGNGSDQAVLLNGVDGNQIGTLASPKDPMFVDSEAGDYRLQTGSTAIDAGNNGLIPDGVVADLDGNCRVANIAVDIGAYEFGSAPVPLVDATLLVDADATSGGNGLTWETAYHDLQSALDRAAALNSDAISSNDVETIWIAEGTYYPTAELDPGDARSASFNLLDGVSLCGGFVGNEASLNQRDLSSHTTTLSGDLGVLDDNSDNAYTVVHCNSFITAAIDGLSVVDGNANAIDDGYIYGKNLGGGIFSGGNLTLTNFTLSDNVAVRGGGIWTVWTSKTVFVNSIISNNLATGGYGYGGGIFNFGEVTIINTTVSGNAVFSDDSGGDGGGIYNMGDLTVVNSTITMNSVTRNGGGILQGHAEAIMTLQNSIVAGNDAAADGADLHGLLGTLVGSHSLIGDGSWQTTLVNGVDGNQIGSSESPIDPMFVDPTTGDYRLRAGSSALDAGDNALAVDANGVALETDLAGNSRVQNGTVDIGAYEGAVEDWGTVRIEMWNRAETEKLEWMDEWMGCWVEVWGQGDAAMGVGSFDVELDFLEDCFTPDLSMVVPGTAVDGGSLLATLDEAEGALRLEGSMQLQKAGQGAEVMLAKIYFKPTSGESALERDTEGHYLSPVADAGFQVDRALLSKEDTETVWPATIQQHDAVPLWPVMYDLNGDSVIDLEDLSQVLTVYRWNVQQSNSSRAWACDLDRSGVVDLHDLSLLLTRYRWQKGDGDTVNYPDDFPFAGSEELVARNSTDAVEGSDVTILCNNWQSGVMSSDAPELRGGSSRRIFLDNGFWTIAAAESAAISASSTDVVFADDLWDEVDLMIVEEAQNAENDEDPSWWDEDLVDLNLVVFED